MLPNSDLPKFPITDILISFGADKFDIPEGYGWLKMKCPFHPDSTASAAVNHELEAFICHGCGVSGDGLKLLQEQGHLEFMDALKRAKEITGIEGESSKGGSRKRRRSSRLFELTRNF